MIVDKIKNLFKTSDNNLDILVHKPIFHSKTRKLIFSWTGNLFDKFIRENREKVVEMIYLDEIENNRDIFNNMSIYFFCVMIKGGIELGWFPKGTTIKFEETLDEEYFKNLNEYKNLDNLKIIAKFKKVNWTKPKKENDEVEKIAITFGGEKDTVASMVLYRKLYPNAKFYLLRQHMNRGKAIALRKHFEDFFIGNFKKEFPVEGYCGVQSNFHSVLERKLLKNLSLGMYFAFTMMPYIKKEQFDIASFAYDASHHYCIDNIQYVARDMIPKNVRKINNIISNFSNTTIRNISYGIPANAHYNVIKILDSKLMEVINPCETTTNKDGYWCHNCEKCLTFAIYQLANKFKNLNYDMSKINKSQHLNMNIIKTIKEMPENIRFNQTKNYFKKPKLSFNAHFTCFCNLMYKMDIDYVRVEYGDDLADKMQLLKDCYGKEYRPEADQYWYFAGMEENEQDAKKLEKIFLDAGLGVSYEKELEFYIDNQKAKYIFNV